MNIYFLKNTMGTLLCLIFLVCATTTYALHPMPQRGSITLRAGGGWGFQTGMITSRENSIAEHAATEGLLTDSTILRLDHTLVSGEFSSDFFVSRLISTGLIYIRRNTHQNMPGSETFGTERTEQLLASHLLGPTATFWKNGAYYNMALSLRSYYAQGLLTRAPILQSIAFTGSTWLPVLTQAQKITGYGFGMRIALYKFAPTGVHISLGVGYDYIHYIIPKITAYPYPSAVDCSNLIMNIAIGFSTKTWTQTR